jgi:hypothetical protein
MSKNKYKVTNWQQYNAGLKQRGSINVWIASDIAQQWRYGGKNCRGGQYQYSATAITICLVVRKVYHLALRQTEGFISSFFQQTGIKLSVPNYTTISRRSAGLGVDLCTKIERGVTDIVVDSTGLKVYGEGEWKVRKHGAGKRRTWMKLHIAADEQSQQIEAVTLTDNSVDDAAQTKALVKQIARPINSFKGDGAYDKQKTRKTLHETNKNMRQVIPPQHNAVTGKKPQAHLQQRDEDIGSIAQVGRKQWKVQNGYHHRSKSETVMFRYKTILGGQLSARKIDNRQTEIRVGCRILNIMLQTAKPISVKVA